MMHYHIHDETFGKSTLFYPSFAWALARCAILAERHNAPITRFKVVPCEEDCDVETTD